MSGPPRSRLSASAAAMAASRPCLARLARALGGGVSLAVFHGNPFDPDERAICENWTFTVPQRRFGAPRFDDAVALLAGRWRAIGYLNEHPVYVHDDAASATTTSTKKSGR